MSNIIFSGGGHSEQSFQKASLDQPHIDVRLRTLVEAKRESRIIISPGVGETIDRKERDRYGLFMAFQNFHCAIILQQPDGSYVAKIIEEKNGTRQVHALPIKKKTLNRIRGYIDNWW